MVGVKVGGGSRSGGHGRGSRGWSQVGTVGFSEGGLR